LYPTVTNLVPYRSYTVGQILTFEVTGDPNGAVWGTTVYTDDSALALACIHAGFITVGVTKIVTVQLLEGRSSYTGSTQNGVTTNSYGSWLYSYTILSAT
jgi:hypothetical protein